MNRWDHCAGKFGLVRYDIIECSFTSKSVVKPTDTGSTSSPAKIRFLQFLARGSP